jgi:hypothetical protein
VVLTKLVNGKMSCLSVEEVANLYLYGRTTKPADMTDGALVRDPQVVPVNYQVDTTDYMVNAKTGSAAKWDGGN